MVRASFVGLTVLLSLFALDAAALGLGGMRAESALNQPFLAEIDLIDVKGDELDTIRVTLASPEDFALSGVERLQFLSQLSFQPGLSARGDPVIRVTSREPIREPFVDLLLQVLWPGGKLIRHYTALLDPPTDTRGAARPAGGASARPATPTPSPAPRPAPVRPAAAPEPTPALSAAIERELQLALETSQEARAQVERLQLRVQDLEKQLAETTAELRMRDAERARLAVAPPEPSPTRVETPPGEVAARESASPASVVPDPAAVTVAASPAPPAESRPSAPRPAPVSETVASSAWHDYLVPLAAMAAVMALGVLALIWQAARPRGGDRLGPDGRRAGHARVDLDPAALCRAGGGRERAEARGETPSALADGAPASGLAALSAELASLARFDAETEEADPLSEADIYVAYGRYKEAEDLLKRELERAPERLDIKFKLAEIHAGSGDSAALRAVMDEIKASGGDRAEPEQWQQLGIIALMVERGGHWDPSAGISITEISAAPLEEPQLDLPEEDEPRLERPEEVAAHTPSRDAGAAVEVAGREPPPLEEVAPVSVQRTAPPRHETALADERMSARQDEEPLLLDEVTFDEDALEALIAGAPTQPPDGGPLSAPRVSAPDDLILTLDDLSEEGALDLDALAAARAPTQADGQPTVPTPSQPSDDILLGSIDRDVLDLLEQRPSRASTDEAVEASSTAGWLADSSIWDENATKLDLARAYLDMDDAQSAREILEEVLEDGNEAQRAEARELLASLR